MEKYKANKNNIEDSVEEQPQKSKDEIDSENNANTIKNAAKVAKATKNPYAMAAGYAVEGLDKLTGGKSTQMLGNAMTQANKTAPGGKQIQNASNKLSESGVGDKIGQAADMKSSGGKDAAAKTSSAASSGSKKLASSKSSSMQKSSTSMSSSGSDGFITDNIMNFKMSPLLKLKLIGIGAGVFFIVCIIVALMGQKDYQNMAVTNLTVFSESSIGATPCTSNELEDKAIYIGGKNINEINLSLEEKSSDFIINNGFGYDSFKNTFLPSLETKLSNTKKSIVVLSFDVYDLNNFNLYLSDYQVLINKFSNINFYVLSFGPVNESLASSYGINNTMLIEYNNKLLNIFGENYIDIYSFIGNGFGTEDNGISYDDETNQRLHNYILNSISGSGKVLCSGNSIETMNESQLYGGTATLLSNGETLVSKLSQEYVNTWNNNIKYDVNKAGKGNGLAPAIAAYDLIQGSLIKGVIIPYYWGGGQEISDGVDVTWGQLKNITKNGNKYQTLGSSYPYGLDGVGFVNWAIKNGGCSRFSYKDANQLISLGKKIEPIEATTGDIIIYNNIAMMVLRNTGTTVYVAESIYDYGVVFATYGYSVLSNYNIVRMSDYYKNNCNS